MGTTTPFLKIALVLSVLSIVSFLLFSPANLLAYTLLFLSAMSFAVHLCAREVTRSSNDPANHFL